MRDTTLVHVCTRLATRFGCARRLLTAIPLLCFSGMVAAQVTVLKSRLLTPNGRPVQEIRLANEPGGNPALVRAMVVTNGPTSGTTTLLTAVANGNVWFDPSAATPTFTSVVASGTVFSVGGGCLRGNQLDFPFIDGNRPKIARFVGGGVSIVPVGVGSELFDSAECAVSGDGTRTFFIFTNRTLQRLFFFNDAGGANDLLNPRVTFSSVKTPFVGGLRPSISVVPGTADTVAMLFMATNGQSRWMQYNGGTQNVEFECLAGVQSPPPAGFTIPRGSRVANRQAIGDFNGDGVFEVVTIQPVNPPPASCEKLPPATPVGPVAGAGFNWSEPGMALNPLTGQLTFLAGFQTLIDSLGALTTVPGPYAGGAGSFATCSAYNTEREQTHLTYATDVNLTQIRAVYAASGRPPPVPGVDLVHASDYEDADILVKAFCFYLGYTN